MRYAIISDIHSNRQALSAVLTDIDSIGVDQIICLGDVVGYGPDPAAVLEMVHSRVHHIVLGNHDAVICGKMDPACFNAGAREIINWTADQLDSAAAEFFGGLPFVLQGDAFACVHAEMEMPSRFGYVYEPKDAARTWAACPDQLVFVGHTHEPGIFVMGRRRQPHWIEAQGFSLESGKRYIVNVGSVGQPRDNDVRSCYCIYDVRAKTVLYRRTPFDVEAFRMGLSRHALPHGPSVFLGYAGAQAKAPVREMVHFSPLKDEDVDDRPVAVQRLAAAERAARRWKRTGVVLTLLLAAMAVAAWGLYSKRPDGAVSYPVKHSGTTLPPEPPGEGEEAYLSPEEIGLITAENYLSSWTVILADPATVSVAAVARHDSVRQSDDLVFHIKSESPSLFTIRSLPFAGKPGIRLGVKASMLNVAWNSGVAEIALVLRSPDGVERTLCSVQPPGLPEKSTWCPASETMESDLAEEGDLHYVIRGTFVGEILVRDCRLVGRKPKG